MEHPILPRRLWYEGDKGRISIEQASLIGRQEPLIILGEAGMGKTELLQWLGDVPGHVYCTARQLKNVRPSPHRLLGNATTLVIDALDELSVQGEGDAVDLVLQRLGDANYPRFILSCRVADWRNATGVTAIQEQYRNVDLRVLHLEPLTDKEAHELLAAGFDNDTAKADEVINHFTAANLDGMLSNPQTLEMIVRVAKAGPLPDTKALLFERAVDILRKEHSNAKVELQPDETTALDAAGAAFAALILTGGDALVTETTELAEGEITIAEVAALPGASRVQAVLGSRLFGTAGAPGRFSYWHRRIGEFLGGRWLARQANTALKRRRLLALFHSYGVVPASLRGLHAWLAHHSRALAPDVIAADPMGVIEYGDADALDATQAHKLVDALKILARRNPRFYERQTCSLKSIAQPQLLEEVRSIINDPDMEFTLRLLLIETVKASPIAEQLRPDLSRILFDRGVVFGLRSSAIDALVTLGSEDWNSVVDTLQAEGGVDGTRLAFQIIDRVGLALFSDSEVISLVIARSQIENSVSGLLYRLEHNVPEKRLEPLLDELVIQIVALGNRHERTGNNELTDFGYSLIGRRLALGSTDAARLWAWLRPFDAEAGYSRDARAKVHKLIRENEQLRRAGQRLVMLDEPGEKSVWERTWRLRRRSPGFTPTTDDVVVLLNALDPSEADDEKWRDLLQLIRHSATEGVEAREKARSFAAGRPDKLAWIDQLADPKIPEWQIKQIDEERKREAKRATKWQKHRQQFGQVIGAMRRGDFAAVVQLANAYTGLYNDLDPHASPLQRLVDWLGEEIADAATKGFEAFLQSEQPPTAQQIAQSYAESRVWNATPIIVSAFAERVSTGRGFSGVSDDRLVAGFYGLRLSPLDRDAKPEGLRPAVEAEMRERGLLTAALQSWIEPQLERRREHIDQLYDLMRCDDDLRATDLAAEWLARFPDMQDHAEEELIDRLIASKRYDVLHSLAAERISQSLSEGRRRTWDAVAFLVDFDAQHERLVRVAKTDPYWLWSIRRRVAGEHGRKFSAPLSVDQIRWLFATFREAFPNTSHPVGVTSGDENPWDASDFFASVLRRLADMTSDKAVTTLTALRDAPSDGYATFLHVLSAEQQRKQTEARYRPPLLAELRAIVAAQAPRTVADLQATLLELLNRVQKRIIADPADPWRDFYADNGAPRDEERCRDHLLTMLGERPESIDLIPEGHLANDNRADIIALLFGMRMPLEIKGQWHPELWRAADTQLDRLYASDYVAERRGIYVVLWFGHNVSDSKKPKASSRGRSRPQTSEELQLGLTAASQSARDRRVVIVVLDLEHA